MEIVIRIQGRVAMLAVNGRVDATTAGDLEAAINRTIAGGHRKILLKFSGVSYISSGGLRILLGTAKKLSGDGDRYALCCLSPEVHKVMKLAGFIPIFTIFESEEEALAAW